MEVIFSRTVRGCIVRDGKNIIHCMNAGIISGFCSAVS